MELILVGDKKSVDAFHDLPYSIYKNDSNWVPPLRMMVESIFDPEKNNSLKNGKARRWLVQQSGKIVGRIAAFVTDTYSYSFEQPTGGVGFFECINDQAVANLLFDTAVDWLKEQGMEAVDGPINIGENFFNWGVLVDGYMQQSFGMQYNLPYYGALFQNYGFKTYYEQYSYQLDITSPDLPDRFWRIAERMSKRPGFTFEQFRFAKKEKFIADFLDIYDKAWKKHDNYKRIDAEDINKMLEESKMMLEEDFIWFVYHDGDPVAFFMMVPDLNQLFKRIPSGKLNLYNIVKMMWLRKRKAISRCRVLVMGVTPKFQKSGIESGIFYQLRQVMLKKMWYNEMELSWVGDFNPKMISIFKAVGGKHEKTHLTLRYLFDPTKEFKRAPIIED